MQAAAAETREAQSNRYPSDARLHWIDLLLSSGIDAGIDKRWVDLLMDTTIVLYTPEVERAGIFLHLTDEHSLRPTVAWYALYGVPVWYPWGSKEAALHRLKVYAPLPHQLQNATTFFTRSPAEVASVPCHTKSAESTEAASRKTPCTKKMDKFFETRVLRNARKVASETPEDRKARLNRVPPRVSAPMYLWEENDDGEYDRVLVPRRERDEMFDEYSKEQMRYDSIQNEWNICSLWGQPLPDFDDTTGADFYPGDDRESHDIPHPSFEVTAHALEDENPIVHSLSGDDSTIPERFETAVLRDLFLYFGYTPLIPLPSAMVPMKESLRKNLCRSLGILWNDVVDYPFLFERPAVAAAFDFLIRLADKESVLSDDEWDLCRANRSPILLSPRFKCFRRVFSTDARPETLYMLDLKEQRLAPWYLALKHARDVAVVCRLPPEKDEYDIVEFLLQNGIPFHTLAVSNTLARSPISLNRTPNPPLRPAKYVFDGRDYLIYREQCSQLLKHPRGRAALMHGCHLWWLSVSVVPWKLVYNGPTGWSSDPREMIVVTDHSSGMELIDDRLTEAEDRVLCGTYHCSTGELFYCFESH